jgi:hypothetical protein
MPARTDVGAGSRRGASDRRPRRAGADGLTEARRRTTSPAAAAMTRRPAARNEGTFTACAVLDAGDAFYGHGGNDFISSSVPFDFPARHG